MKKRLSILVVLAMIIRMMTLTVLADGDPIIGEVSYDKATSTASFMIENVEDFTVDNIKSGIKAYSLMSGAWRMDYTNDSLAVSYNADEQMASIKINKTVYNGYRYDFTIIYGDSFTQVASFEVESNEYASASDIDVWNNAGSYWKAYHRSWGNSYEIMNGGTTQASIYTFTIADKQKVGSGQAWAKTMQDKSAAIENNSVACFVGQGLMSPGSGQANAETAVKAFFVPYSGKIRISQNNLLTNEEARKNEIWGPNPASENKSYMQLNLRIIKNGKDNVVWPADGDMVSISKANGGIYAFEPVEMEVKKGDVLYFEVKRGSYLDAWTCYAYWNPVVTYTEVSADAVFKDGNGSELKTDSGILSSENAQLELTAINYSSDESAAQQIDSTPIVAFYAEDGSLIKAVVGNEKLSITKTEKNTQIISLGNVSEMNAKSAKVMLWDDSIRPLTSVIKELSR